MNSSRSFKSIAIALLLATGLAACDQPGPAEKAGKKIDQTTDAAGQKIGAAVDEAGKKLDEQGVKAGTAIDDAEITARVKAAIFAEPGLATLQISVGTVDGVVTLSGSVDSQQRSDTAKGLAAAVAGVKKVDNQLALKAGHSD